MTARFSSVIRSPARNTSLRKGKIRGCGRRMPLLHCRMHNRRIHCSGADLPSEHRTLPEAAHAWGRDIRDDR